MPDSNGTRLETWFRVAVTHGTSADVRVVKDAVAVDFVVTAIHETITREIRFASVRGDVIACT